MSVPACKPKFDGDDPRAVALVRQISDANEAFSRAGTTPIVLDLGSLNNGNWTTACVYGGYNNPRQEMIDLGGKVSAADEARLADARTRSMRAAEVEETESMIAYIDSAGDAHFLHFRGGFGQFAEFGKRCISKAETLARLR